MINNNLLHDGNHVMSVQIIVHVSQTPVDHLLNVQLVEAVSVSLDMKSPRHTFPLEIHTVVLVSTP